MALAFRLLARRARSRSEVEGALAARGFSAGMIRTVLARIADLGYLDDRRLAADTAERLAERGYGRLRIERELQRRGVGERIVLAALPPAREEERRARELLAARFRTGDLSELRERARAARYLASRGFEAEVVRGLLEEA
jgi:regulatory protein